LKDSQAKRDETLDRKRKELNAKIVKGDKKIEEILS
jgi:hypothetical protein